MALSLYSNWATLENPILDMNPFNEHPSEVAEALAGFCEPVESSHLLIDSLFDQQPTEVVNTPVSYHHLSLSDPAVVLSLPTELRQPSDDTEFYQSRKRPRSCGDLYHPPDLMFEANSYFNGAPSTPPMMSSNFKMQTKLTQDFMAPPPVVSGLFECNSEKKAGSGGCLSAQSVAARERRKKISEKTQELGQLIPGGNKMNTAEMFQAAYKYVKFLQSQVGILGLLGSNKRYKASEEMQEKMQVLLSSPTIQEKLSGERKCVVPKVMVEALAEDKEIKSNIMISRELDRFVKSLG